MLKIRRSEDRGHADHGWLKSKHSFSFASYHDPKHVNFGPLRVINEDHIAGGTGFGQHGHRDMEIITYVVKGSLQHQDTMGNQAVIRPGEVQKMSAGLGVEHSEMNNEATEETHLFQIWIIPDRQGIKPSYGQKSFAESLAKEPLVLVISGDGREGSIAIQQDADLYIAKLKTKERLHFGLKAERGAWVQVVRGSISLGEEILNAGDAAALTEETRLEMVSRSDAEILLFDLPML